MTGKKVKGAGGGGLGKRFFLKIKKSLIICNGDDHASRHPRAPHTDLGPRMEGRGRSPCPSTLRPTPQIKPSQVSMSHRTSPPINSCKYVQIMPVTFGAPPSYSACLPQPGPLPPQLHLSNKRRGAACHAVEGRGTLGRGGGLKGVGLAFKPQEGFLACPASQEGNLSCTDFYKISSNNVGEGGTVTQAKNRS